MKFALLTALLALPFTAFAQEEESTNRYTQQIFVANKSIYSPTFKYEPQFINAWGIAIRPAGAGGHFWITAKDISYEYIGDVRRSPDPKLHKLQQDELKVVKLPVGGADKFSTSTVFSGSKKDFVITQEVKGAEPITAPTKFFFSSDGGIISAWTERKKEDGSFDWPETANNVIDRSKEGAQYFGLALSHDYDTLYAVNFGVNPGIEVYGGDFKPRPLQFEQPFDGNKNGKVDPGEYAPFNIQQFTLPTGQPRLFVTYAKTRACPAAEVQKKTCAQGELFPGEEDITAAGNGRLVEFTEQGEVINIWDDSGQLSAPWGMAIAPADFGELSGMLLVANFGSGTIAAYDMETHGFVDVLRDAKGKPVVIDKIWGLLFGNGVGLGDSNALYFTAGPKDETDGIFGALRPVK